MFESRLTLVRVRGIPIGINGSWALIAAFLTWTLARRFPHTFPGLGSSAYLAMALSCVLLLFASIVLHELGHAFRALKEGVQLEGITLWLFGGVATFRDEFPSAGAELRIAAAGPAATAGLALGFAGVDWLAGRLGVPLAVRGVLEYASVINILLLAFNVVPALPLDGGRILRALLWRRGGDLASATRTAAFLGQALGLLLGAVGVGYLVRGALVTGLSVAGVGVFVVKGARVVAPGPPRREAADLGGDLRRALRADRARRRAQRRDAGPMSRAWRGAKLLGGLVAALALGLFWHPPVYVLSPGTATDVSHDLTIDAGRSGLTPRVPGGEYLLTTVLAQQHTLFKDLVEVVRPHRELITTGDVGSITFQDDMFRESQLLGAVAAGQAAGVTVTVSGNGTEVIGAVRGTPAAGALRPGDVVIAVDGTPVHNEFDLRDAVSVKPVGTQFALRVQRGGTTLDLSTASSRLTQGSGPVTALGVQVVTKDGAITGPFTVTFKQRPIGGPSAGLVYALAVSDALGLVRSSPGQAVAATGTMDAQGNVGAVGGVELKAIGAREQGADLFLVPAGETASPKGLIAQVRGVTTLQDALAILRSRE